MANLPKIGQGVSNWDPTGEPSGDATAKLMNPVARENMDNVTSSNKKEQYMGGKAAGKFGKLGKQGNGF